MQEKCLNSRPKITFWIFTSITDFLISVMFLQGTYGRRDFSLAHCQPAPLDSHSPTNQENGYCTRNKTKKPSKKGQLPLLKVQTPFICKNDFGCETGGVCGHTCRTVLHVTCLIGIQLLKEISSIVKTSRFLRKVRTQNY